MVIKLSTIETATFNIFFVLFLFATLISRITGFNINMLTYIVFMVVLLLSLRYVSINPINITFFLCLSFFSLYHLDNRFTLQTNIMAAKDFCIPLLAFLIGSLLSNNKQRILPFVNFSYFLFILYGIIQVILFYCGLLEHYLPWDQNHINALISGGTFNIVQGRLLRFFGTMDSFVEYQVIAVFIGLFLWLNVKYLSPKVFAVNISLLILFLLMSFERTPILMFLLTVTLWKLDIHKARTIIAIVIVFLSVFLTGMVLDEKISQNDMLYWGWNRIKSVVTLSLDNDDAVQERANNQWVESIEIAKQQYFGIGAANLSYSARLIGNDQIDFMAPHNNYLTYYLAYGIFGISLWLLFMFMIIKQVIKLDKSNKKFAIGCLVSFLAMAIFNIPFIGRCGMVFYLILGFLLASNDNSKELSK